VFDSESDPDGQGAAELYDDDGEEGVYGTVEEEECGDGFEERKAEVLAAEAERSNW
jgi:hypothetical protein